MNIVIFIGYLDAKLNANTKIAVNIGRSLAKLGHNITIAGFSRVKHIQGPTIENTDIDNLKIAHITESAFIRKQRSRADMFKDNLISKKGLTVKQANIRYAFSHPFSTAVIAFGASPLYSKDVAEFSADFLAEYCDKNKTDCIIAVTDPFFTVNAVFRDKVKVPKKVIYQLDPYGLHELHKFEENEPEYFKKADIILTTEILKDEYAFHKDYSSFTDKIYGIPFPSFVKSAVTQKSDFLNKEKLNIVYCGFLNDGYRNPQKALSLFIEAAKINPNINIHFFGYNRSSICKEYQKQYPENVFIHNQVDSSVIPSILNDANILLNIGNNLKLQLPSKIFEYFATGKPIVHLETTYECNCRKYIQDYPLSYIISNNDDDKNADKLYDFITLNRNNRVDISVLDKQYHSYTPDAVALKIHNIISKC